MPENKAFAHHVYRTALKGYEYKRTRNAVEPKLKLNEAERKRLADQGVEQFGFGSAYAATQFLQNMHISDVASDQKEQTSVLQLRSLRSGDIVELKIGQTERFCFMAEGKGRCVTLYDSRAQSQYGDVISWLQVSIETGGDLLLRLTRNGEKVPDANLYLRLSPVSQINVMINTQGKATALKKSANIECQEGEGIVYAIGVNPSEKCFTEELLTTDAESAIFKIDFANGTFEFNQEAKFDISQTDFYKGLLAQVSEWDGDIDNIFRVVTETPGRFKCVTRNGRMALKVTEYMKLNQL